MKKALLVTTVSGFVPQFEMNNVKLLQELGYEVHYAANYNTPSYGDDNSRLDGTGIIRHQVDFVRSPYSIKNISAYCQLKKLMKENKFSLVHCHTPMGGALARIAAHSARIKNVIYTAHGFHFYKGAPLKNWLIYYTMEYLLSYWTFQQICINKEDYKIAKRKFHAAKVDYIPGVGLDCSKFGKGFDDANEIKKELGLPLDKKILLSAGELIKRKNHETIIKAIKALNDENIIYVICGHGELDEYLKKLAQDLKVQNSVRFLGYRNDIYRIYQIADLFVFPSYQEGLPFALLEAMASGKAAVCSKIRGNIDLIKQEEIMVDAKDVEGFCKVISKVLSDEEYRKRLEEQNLKTAKRFDKKSVMKIMNRIYKQFE